MAYKASIPGDIALANYTARYPASNGLALQAVMNGRGDQLVDLTLFQLH
jgi:hypothetical protein